MMNGRKARTLGTEAEPAFLRLTKRSASGRYRLVSWVLAHKAVSEAIVTRVHFQASAQTVWNHLMLYEEVPGRPPFLLRTLLPHPLRTEGDKTQVGATVRCAYQRSYLVKRITAVRPPHLLQFEVIEQCLGIEDCVLTRSGSYRIDACGETADLVLVTNYRASLRPRYLWRPVEAFLIGQLHRHILRGISTALLAGRPAVAESLEAECALAGDLACTAFQSVSRR